MRKTIIIWLYDISDSQCQLEIESQLSHNTGKNRRVKLIRNRKRAEGALCTLPDDIHGGWNILLLVDSHDKHGCIRRRRRDDDLLSPAVQVRAGLVNACEATSRLDDVLGTISAPRDFFRVAAAAQYTRISTIRGHKSTYYIYCTAYLSTAVVAYFVLLEFIVLVTL